MPGTYLIIHQEALKRILVTADVKTAILLWLEAKRKQGASYGELADLLPHRNRRTLERALDALMRDGRIVIRGNVYYSASSPHKEYVRTKMRTKMRASTPKKGTKNSVPDAFTSEATKMRASTPKKGTKNSVPDAFTSEACSNPPHTPPIKEKELRINPPLTPPKDGGAQLVERIERLKSSEEGKAIVALMPGEATRRERLTILEAIVASYPPEIIRTALEEVRLRLPKIRFPAIYLQVVCERLHARTIPIGTDSHPYTNRMIPFGTEQAPYTERTIPPREDLLSYTNWAIPSGTDSRPYTEEASSVHQADDPLRDGAGSVHREVPPVSAQKPFGKASCCPECGAEPEVRYSVHGIPYYQLPCDCCEKRATKEAWRRFVASLRGWKEAISRISALSSLPEKERDPGLEGIAWSTASRTALEAMEYASNFGFSLPEAIDSWVRKFLPHKLPTPPTVSLPAEEHPLRDRPPAVHRIDLPTLKG